ncbi:MAG: hypothetical protein NVSMB47_17820 [Polyangiales bacterium]
MSALPRRLLLALALVGAPFAVATTADTAAHADKKNPQKDPLADKFAGQILFYDKSPPATVGGPGWFAGNKISKREENSDKKWVLHTMVFLKKTLDVAKLDIMVYKTDKKGNTEFVQKLEQFPATDGRSFYFVLTMKKYDPVVIEPNLKYTFKAVATTGGVAEGTIELDGKEESVGGNGNLDFTNGDLGGPKKEEKATAPFDAESAKESLKAIIYEDCKTAASAGGNGKLMITIDPKTGKAVKVTFNTDPAPPFSDGTQKCIVGRFEKVKVKPYTGDTKTLAYHVSL